MMRRNKRSALLVSVMLTLAIVLFALAWVNFRVHPHGTLTYGDGRQLIGEVRVVMRTRHFTVVDRKSVV